MPTESESSPTTGRHPYQTSHGVLAFERQCLVMGVLNVTPDSFSDGGQFLDTRAAVDRALAIASEGAAVLDIGGESTRPGAAPVPADEQIERVVPVIRAARERGLAIPVSIDTRSAKVAAAALNAGADIVNDISAARHAAAMPELLAERNVPFVIMHMQGTPETMQNDPQYDDVVAEVRAFFDARAETLADAGVDVNRMIVDPGIGFGKTPAHNLALIRNISAFGVRWPVLMGVSRKAFLGRIIGIEDPTDRLMPTAAAVAACVLGGASMVRVHDVASMRQVVQVSKRIAETG